MILEIRRIDSASAQSLLEIFATMKSLAAGRNLNSQIVRQERKY